MGLGGAAAVGAGVVGGLAAVDPAELGRSTLGGEDCVAVLVGVRVIVAPEKIAGPDSFVVVPDFKWQFLFWV